MAGIIGGASEEPNAGVRAPAESNASITHRARAVLAIRGFRRLWGVTYLCSIGDWLSLLALTGLVTKLTAGYQAQSFAFAGVVLTQLLPGLLFAPLGGLLADRFDRRKVMVICDVLRCGLFVSIAVVGSTVWLFVGNFLIGCCAMMWIPSKDAAVPNLLRRPDQVETASQLGLVMTYGLAVITGAGLYAAITGITTNLNIQPDPDGLGIAKIILVINGLLYLTSAILVATRIPELSRRDTSLAESQRADKKAAEDAGEKPGLLAMARDAGRFVRSTPLVRGLLIGMIGAFAAAGALIGTANLYADSLPRRRVHVRSAVRRDVHRARRRHGRRAQARASAAAQPAVRHRHRARRAGADPGRAVAAPGRVAADRHGGRRVRRRRVPHRCDDHRHPGRGRHPWPDQRDLPVADEGHPGRLDGGDAGAGRRWSSRTTSSCGAGRCGSTAPGRCCWPPG